MSPGPAEPWTESAPALPEPAASAINRTPKKPAAAAISATSTASRIRVRCDSVGAVSGSGASEAAASCAQGGGGSGGDGCTVYGDMRCAETDAETDADRDDGGGGAHPCGPGPEGACGRPVCWGGRSPHPGEFGAEGTDGWVVGGPECGACPGEMAGDCPGEMDAE